MSLTSGNDRAKANKKCARKIPSKSAPPKTPNRHSINACKAVNSKTTLRDLSAIAYSEGGRRTSPAGEPDLWPGLGKPTRVGVLFRWRMSGYFAPAEIAASDPLLVAVPSLLCRSFVKSENRPVDDPLTLTEKKRPLRRRATPRRTAAVPKHAISTGTDFWPGAGGRRPADPRWRRAFSGRPEPAAGSP